MYIQYFIEKNPHFAASLVVEYYKSANGHHCEVVRCMNSAHYTPVEAQDKFQNEVIRVLQITENL